MSVEFERLDAGTLKRLDLPPSTAESPQGLENILIAKVLNLVYIVNASERPHQFLSSGIGIGAAITADGIRYTTPINERRLVWGLHLIYTCSATAGTRVVRVRRHGKDDFLIQEYARQNLTATQSLSVNIHVADGTTGPYSFIVNRQITNPIHMEPETFFLIDDAVDISPTGDTVTHRIEYVPFPI